MFKKRSLFTGKTISSNHKKEVNEVKQRLERSWMRLTWIDAENDTKKNKYHKKPKKQKQFN